MPITIVGQDPSVAKRVTCFNCGAILQYARNDIQERPVSNMGDVDTKRYIPCPNCHYEVRV